MHFTAKAGHLGSGLSSIDLLTYLYQKGLRKGDKFILSKGHGASALYATLHHFGILSDEEIQSYYQDGTLFPAHPAACAHPAIPAATGSLGHGLSVATGLVYCSQVLREQDAQVFCLLSDGECNEGSVWEAALFAAHHRLKNLIAIIDANGLQGFGRTEDVLGLEPLRQKWEAFRFRVVEVNGHDFDQLDSAFRSSVEDPSSQPLCIIARTVKGKGVSFMENKMEWHYEPLNEAQFLQANQELLDEESKILGISANSRSRP